MVLRVLQHNRKVRCIDGVWYHAAPEVPQHEVGLRMAADRNVVIRDVDTGEALGEISKFDAPPILHPEAIYMHRGDTYRVLALDLERNLAEVKREQTDYYTNPLGGTDIHHVDNLLRRRPFGTGRACWGEVTAYFQTYGYEKVRFYHLDTVSTHRLELPRYQLETMALWIVPPQDVMARVREAGLDAHGGLRGIGYAVRMALPLFMTCDALDFSHTIGAVNAEWNAIFVYERYRHGLGFTATAYERLHEILPAVRDALERCPCEEGCPCCVGKPLRPYDTWNVERGEGSIPSKAAALAILRGLMARGPLRTPDEQALSDTDGAARVRLEQALRRRLERMREPELFHPIEPRVEPGYPEREADEALGQADVARRAGRRRTSQRELRRRLAKKIRDHRLDPMVGRPDPPPGTKTGAGRTPLSFPGRPARDRVQAQQVSDVGPHLREEQPTEKPAEQEAGPSSESLRMGDSLAARARRRRKERERGEGAD
jgi:ATP-dependent helicase YprA (DUF1998 family)